MWFYIALKHLFSIFQDDFHSVLWFGLWQWRLLCCSCLVFLCPHVFYCKFCLEICCLHIYVLNIFLQLISVMYFFQVRSLKMKILSSFSADSMGAGASAKPRFRLYITLALAAFQPIIIYWLTAHLVRWPTVFILLRNFKMTMLDWDGFKFWHCYRKVAYHGCVFFTEDLCGLIFNIGFISIVICRAIVENII